MGVYQGGSVPRTGGPDGVGVDNAPWTRWQDWVNLILGIWLFVSPWAMEKTGGMALISAHMATDAWIMGIILVIVSLWALARPIDMAPEGINMLAGIWLFITPWALSLVGTMHSASVNNWIIGVIVFLLALGASRHTQTGSMKRA